MVITEEEFDKQLHLCQCHHYTPEKDLREDIRFRVLARELGWDILYGNDFGDSIMFRKGTKTIWWCHVGWRCGDSTVNTPQTPYIDRRYHDYEHLNDALKAES